MNERVAYFSIVVGRSLCESKQAGQTYRHFLPFLTSKRQRERGKKILLSLLAAHKHTTGNSVHCVEKCIGQAL